MCYCFINLFCVYEKVQVGKCMDLCWLTHWLGISQPIISYIYGLRFCNLVQYQKKRLFLEALLANE